MSNRANTTATKERPGRSIDRATRAWIRNASDRDAVHAHGCRFNIARAAFAVWWIEKHCRLYEGDQAGEPLILHGCKKCGTYGIETPEEFIDEGMEACLERARLFAQCVKARHELDWQYDCTMRVFGWMTYNAMRAKKVRRFNESIVYIGKKNKKSPTLAAWGMYLLVGDEEPGQKVFLAAKDGQQVRANTSKHSVEMVRQSPALNATCTINKVEMRITHEPSRSVMIPLSSSNVRTHKAKEGLNGSLLVDETHVVDREFMARISRAGISRAEPLLAEFSTAGDDPDSYGKERFDLAERIIRGDEPDFWRTFAAVFAAPQDLSDADLDADPLKYGRMANPALGHTVDATEYLEDYNKSKKSPSNLATFKMYRLDIWQNAATPWLPMTGWNAGRRDIQLADFTGQRCWSALDLASVRDFAALTLDFPQGVDVHNLFWWFWLPEDTAAEVKHLIPIEAWLADPRCNLILTPGARTDYGYIRSHFRELAERFEIMELAYDDWNAEQTTQEIEEGVRNRAGEQIEQGTGVPRLNFSQSLKEMNEPSKRFEAAVIDGNILHDGNPLAAWMAGNATIRPDVNGNYKPLKPKRDSVKKIDGVVTAIMAYWRATMADAGGSVYDEPGAMKW
jgi:phage terminase large subunit-like protein